MSTIIPFFFFAILVFGGCVSMLIALFGSRLPGQLGQGTIRYKDTQITLGLIVILYAFFSLFTVILHQRNTVVEIIMESAIISLGLLVGFFFWKERKR